MQPRAKFKRCVAVVSALWLALLFGFVNCGYAWDYGNGRHGIYVLTTNTTIEQLYQTIRLTNDPAQYNPADSNAIPNFQNLIITNGATLNAVTWNGTSGGRVVLKVQSTLYVAPGAAILVSGEGYRGGGSTFMGGFFYGLQGESYAGSPTTSYSANYGGGGGGPAHGCGGGGGYSTGGTTGGSGGTQGSGGGTYGTTSLSTVYLGSGGGGDGYGGSGANGGGAIVLNVGYLNAQGQIQASGGDSPSYYSGAGSGGSILLQIGSGFLGVNNVKANGGNGFSYGYGGYGGAGRIAVAFAEGFTGTTTPIAYSANDTNSDSITIISQPISQSAFLGTNVVFNVGTKTISTYTMQWFFNGNPIVNATNLSLSITNVSFTNQGNYWLTISDPSVSINSSIIVLTVLDTRSPFGDGIPNWWLEEYGLSTNDPTLATNYPPADKLTYLEKYLYGLNPLTNDTDGDGLTDYDEIFIYHTNPLLPGTASDGIPDGWKVQYGINPLIADANSEAGFDGLTYLQIYQYNLTHTNQLNPVRPFATGSSFSNFEIINNGLHTNRYYYDHEDRLLGIESSKGISIGYQYDGNGNLVRQSVLSRTAETNGLPVLWLWLNGLTNQPGIAYVNSSGNGWNNYQEWRAGLSPISNSVPDLLENPGTNIGALTVPFTPTNWVMATGQLNGMAGDEIVVGADGNATGKTNSVFILTQEASAWQVTQLPVGAMGITSIAVGQPTNRPLPAIYLGLRQNGGTGAIWELIQTNGVWQTNVLAASTNSAAFVLGVRSTDVLSSFATNGLDGGLYSLTYINGVWNQTVISANISRRGLGTHGQVFAQTDIDSSLRLLDAGGIEVFGSATNEWLIPEPLATSRLPSRGLSLAVGLSRPNQTNSTSVFYAFGDDWNLSGILDAGDVFTLAEFVVSGNFWTNKTLFQVPITSGTVSQSFGLAAANFTGTGKDTLFTGEPDGRIYSWTGNDASNPLQRQLFSDAYAGQAWQAMSGVQTAGLGKGLAGTLVNLTNQSTCNVIYWQPQAVLPTPTPSVIETAPYAVVIPSNTTLGSNAVVSVRLWHSQGDASTPFLQFQFFGSTNWQNATLTALDGLAYNTSMRVAALPTGSTHLLAWNALIDVGANVVTNVLLRASAQDFMLTGSWSMATPFQLNTSVATVSIPPANFTSATSVRGGIQFSWQGGSNALMYLQRSPTLAGPNAVWVDIWTSAPPTLNFGSYTDFFGTNSMEFYRFQSKP